VNITIESTGKIGEENEQERNHLSTPLRNSTDISSKLEPHYRHRPAAGHRDVSIVS